MPELPEVETICNQLRFGNQNRKPALGLRVLSVEVLWARSIAHPNLEVFHQQVKDKLIHKIGRRGKFLVFSLSDDFFLLIHLRMSGDLWVESQDASIHPHHRVMFNLENHSRMVFNDSRKFGRVWLTKEPQEILSKLGPEPLDSKLTPEDFYHRLTGRHRQLKPLLLDQTVIAGLGNIYTDEALHLAGLHPLTLSNQLTFDQASLLLKSIQEVLLEGISRNGASIDWVYRGGEFQNYFQVYQRTGESCYRCGEKIRRTVVGQRGTHYCPNCQPEPEHQQD